MSFRGRDCGRDCNGGESDVHDEPDDEGAEFKGGGGCLEGVEDFIGLENGSVSVRGQWSVSGNL